MDDYTERVGVVDCGRCRVCPQESWASRSMTTVDRELVALECRRCAVGRQVGSTMVRQPALPDAIHVAVVQIKHRIDLEMWSATCLHLIHMQTIRRGIRALPSLSDSVAKSAGISTRERRRGVSAIAAAVWFRGQAWQWSPTTGAVRGWFALSMRLPGGSTLHME